MMSCGIVVSYERMSFKNVVKNRSANKANIANNNQIKIGALVEDFSKEKEIIDEHDKRNNR